MPSVLDLLRADHQQVRDQFSQYSQSAQPEPDKQRLAGEICKALTVHATVEEELFYPAVRDAITNKVLIDHAEQEHAQAKQMIGQIEANLNNSLARDPAIQTLQAAVLQHVQEEESQIFSEVQASNLDLEDLGTRAEARKNELMSAS